MLINLSNHKSAAWTPEQLSTAMAQYGGVHDLDFPQIPPTHSTAEVQQLAQAYLKELQDLQLHNTDGITVHLMGEMTFCYALCSLLKAEGIKVVASTTQRIAIEANGVKTSMFKFVQFRAY
jgi:hypothetical protein